MTFVNYMRFVENKDAIKININYSYYLRFFYIHTIAPGRKQGNFNRMLIYLDSFSFIQRFMCIHARRLFVPTSNLAFLQNITFFLKCKIIVFWEMVN